MKIKFTTGVITLTSSYTRNDKGHNDTSDACDKHLSFQMEPTGYEFDCTAAEIIELSAVCKEIISLTR